MSFRIEPITAKDDQALADLIRGNLEKYHLDKPGTAYFDKSLDHLSEYYLSDERKAYFVLKDDEGTVCGGVGMAEFPLIPRCAEMQKLYLADEVKGRGLSYRLIHHLEQAAAEKGYQRIYLETHTNLAAAIHVYENCGYRRIEKPEGVVHAAMDRFFLKEL